MVNVKLKPRSVMLAILAFAILMAITALASFGLWDFTTQNLLVLKVFASLIIFTEVGLATIFKKGQRNIDVLGLVGLIAGVTILVTIILEFFGTVLPILSGIQGIVFAVLTVSFLVEAFR